MPKAPRDLPVIAFSSQQAFDVWLASQPGDCRGLWLKVAKKSSGDRQHFKGGSRGLGAVSWLDRRPAR
jgi:uncharacterized protein YdeI (YjbR/CyaY-like superfamily)